MLGPPAFTLRRQPVIAVAESQTVDAAGQLTDVYEVTYTLPNRPGSFTLEVPKSGDPVAAAEAAIAALSQQVGGIYSIP